MTFEHIVVVKKLDAPNATPVQAVFVNVRLWADSHNITHEVYDDNDDTVTSKKALVVAIGGDGTVILASKIANHLRASVIGFNLGKIGFLSDFDPKHVWDTLSMALAGSMVRESREMLSVGDGDNTHNALNDVVISCEQSDTSFQYDLLIDNKFAGTHMANGVIFSTPTGSTAYALNVGGAIMAPSMEGVMQIVPIAAQTMTSRPLIVPSDPGARIIFRLLKERPISIRVDGVKVKTLVNEEDSPVFAQVSINQSLDHVSLLHHSNWNHFETLSKKLGWNK